MAQFSEGLKMSSSDNGEHLLMNADLSNHASTIRMRTGGYDWFLKNQGNSLAFEYKNVSAPGVTKQPLVIEANGDFVFSPGAEIHNFYRAYGHDGSGLGLGGHPGTGTAIYLNPLNNNVVVNAQLTVGTSIPASEDNTKLLVDGRVHVSPEGGVQTAFNVNEYGSYLLWIDGGMVAENFAIANSEDWADFVFDDNYELPDLETIENFIKKNGHLPTIPSEEEVKEEGYRQHEISKQFTQTLEELTLHTIAQEKRIKVLTKKLAELE
jgi:hypothetical protein